jgi:fumarate reductase subunit D
MNRPQTYRGPSFNVGWMRGAFTYNNSLSEFVIDMITSSIESIITLFRSITMFCGTDNIVHNIHHIQIECGIYFGGYC